MSSDHRDGDADGVLVATIDDGKANALTADGRGRSPVRRAVGRGPGRPLLVTGRDGCFSAGFDLAVMERATRTGPRPSSPTDPSLSGDRRGPGARRGRRAPATHWPAGPSSCCVRTTGSVVPDPTKWDSMRSASVWRYLPSPSPSPPTGSNGGSSPRRRCSPRSVIARAGRWPWDSSTSWRTIRSVGAFVRCVSGPATARGVRRHQAARPLGPHPGAHRTGGLRAGGVDVSRRLWITMAFC